MATLPPSEVMKGKISETDVPEINEIPFNLVAQHERKTTQLLNNATNQSPVKSQNRYFHFKFNQPIFILDVDLSLNQFIDGSLFEYQWEGVDGIIHNGDEKSKGDNLLISINGIAKSISFKPPKVWFTKPHINGVSIYGFELRDAGKFIDYASTIDSFKDKAIQSISASQEKLQKDRAEVAALQAQRGTLQQDIDSFKTSASREQAKAKRIEMQKNELITQSGEIERNLSADQGKLNDMRLSLSKMTDLRSTLSANIEKKRTTLSELEGNIDLFPSELSGFSKQGAKDFRYFFFLSLVPISVIILMFILLVRGAADLTTKITGSEAVNLAALAVSRAPYVVISITIITICYYIARMLILEMVRISRQRLSLSKISIIAKDISISIEHDLNLSDSEIYNKRLYLKMAMMRDHLKEYLSSDFSPTLPDNITPAATLAKLPPKPENASHTEE